MLDGQQTNPQTFNASSLKDLVIAHLLFAASAVAILLGFAATPIGIRMLAAVLLYNIMIPCLGRARGHKEWFDIWSFVLPLSILQLFPDLFLSASLNVLAFSGDGFLIVGTVPAYMAGLWAIPFFFIVCAGLWLERTKSRTITLLLVGLLSLVIFILAEETMWMLPSWHAQNVTMVGHVAIYIVVPEIMLGVSTYLVYKHVMKRPLWQRIVWIYVVMALYVGNAGLSYLLVENLLFAA